MQNYSVKQLSSLAGVSIRTLHHYDKIGLLKPAFRSEKGYRFYQKTQLLLLQQILFYRELGFPLAAIHAILTDPDFELIPALLTHKKELKKRQTRLKQLLKTIDKTLDELNNKENMMKETEIYEGFSSAEVDSMRAEVMQKWGREELEATEERIRALGKDGWDDTKKKGEEINHLLVRLMGLEPAHVQVQQAVALHFRHLNVFYAVTKERYLALGKMYVEDERFCAHYEAYGEGLAEFLNAGIQVFCENDLEVVE